MAIGRIYDLVYLDVYIYIVNLYHFNNESANYLSKFDESTPSTASSPISSLIKFFVIQSFRSSLGEEALNRRGAMLRGLPANIFLILKSSYLCFGVRQLRFLFVEPNIIAEMSMEIRQRSWVLRILL